MKISKYKCPHCQSTDNKVTSRIINIFNDETYCNAIAQNEIKDIKDNKLTLCDNIILQHCCCNCRNQFYTVHLIDVTEVSSNIGTTLKEIYNKYN